MRRQKYFVVKAGRRRWWIIGFSSPVGPYVSRKEAHIVRRGLIRTERNERCRGFISVEDIL